MILEASIQGDKVFRAGKRMDVEEVIEQILVSRSDLTRDTVLKLIEKKKRDAKGFFKDDTAARLVASELGIKIPQNQLSFEVKIGNLVSGLNDVTVTGKVIQLDLPREFRRQDRTKGKYARLLIENESGKLEVVLWDGQTDMIEGEKIREGHLIRVAHGYVREGLNGKLELHVGSRGEIKVDPRAQT